MKFPLWDRLSEDQKETIKKNWHKFSTNPLSIIGLCSVITVIFVAVFAPWLAPSPQSWGRWVDFSHASLPPSWKYLFGTDIFGRDVLSRTMFGFRYDLLMALCILGMVVLPGTFLGLVAGYYKETWIDTVIMRISDIFLSIPSLVLALAICALLEPSLFNSMMAVSVLWWPWYTRLAYGITSSLRNEYFVQAAELMGANPFSIMFREILPNCLSPIFTKMTLDVGWVILIGSTLSFVGLGAQEPLPALGNMVAQGSKYMPDYWWMAIFPALAIAFTILGFNLLGDGIRDMWAVEEI
jgi:peptide/nickel transport system permease protein